MLHCASLRCTALQLHYNFMNVNGKKRYGSFGEGCEGTCACAGAGALTMDDVLYPHRKVELGEDPVFFERPCVT